MDFKVSFSFKELPEEQEKNTGLAQKTSSTQISPEFSYESYYDGACKFLDDYEIFIVEQMPSCPKKTSVQLKMISSNQLWRLRAARLTPNELR